jgi:hypothetical protein
MGTTWARHGVCELALGDPLQTMEREGANVETPRQIANIPRNIAGILVRQLAMSV